MKHLLSFVAFLLLSSSVFAQTGKLRGTVTDITGNTLPGVSTLIKNTNIGASTDATGVFTISSIADGDYILSVSSVGFKTKEVPFKIAQNEVDLNTITLYEGDEILREVIVEGERDNKFSRNQTAYVSKLPLKDFENTQVYSTITNYLLKTQIVTNFDDALKNAAGVDNLWTSTGRGGDGAGYYTLRGFSVQPKLVNGLPGLTNGTINPANIEHIEVLKGPSATLFGNAVSSYGGLINVVTKKPYVGTGGELSFTTGSYGLNQIVGDFNTALSKEKNIYFRLNTSYLTERSFQDAGFRKSFFVAPSLSYKVNNKLSFSFYGEITQAEQTNPMFLFLNRSAPTQSKNMRELGYNYKRSFTSNDLTLQNPTQNYRVEMDYKLSDTWQSQTLVSKSATSTKGYYSYLFDYGILGNDTFSRFLNKQNEYTGTSDIQQNFIGDFKLGKLRNRVVVGLDYFSATTTSNGTGYAFYGNVTPEGGSSGDDPFTDSTEIRAYPLSAAAVDAVLATQPVANQKSRFNIFSAYASDVLNITDHLSVMAGLRLDHFDNVGDVTTSEDNYNQTTLSPKFGILYQPVLNKLSVFANYQNGFTNVAPALVGDPKDGPQTIKSFRPEQANQFEFGIKTNLIKNKLNATISYYDIKVKDQVIADPASIFNKIQGGEAYSRGFEIEVNATPVRGLDIRAGYSKNDSKTTKSDNLEILGKRPLGAGSDVLYNFWANYEVPNGNLKGFGLGVGANGASERFAINYVSTGDFMLPAYTVANGALFYQADHYRIGLKLNNAFNKEYYKGWSTIAPQMPRALLANFTYSF
jgi:iron complex outermembrane receptor protein